MVVRRVLVFALFLGMSFLGSALAVGGPEDCESPLILREAPQILALARESLSQGKSPRHQRQVALHSLMNLEKNLSGASEAARSVFHGEIFDMLFEHFSSICTFEEMPNLTKLVPELRGSRLSKLLKLYKKLIDDPDDTTVAPTAMERFQIRLTLDRLLLEVGRYHGWDDLDYDRPVPEEASEWFLNFMDPRRNPTTYQTVLKIPVEFLPERESPVRLDESQLPKTFSVPKSESRNFFASRPHVSMALRDLDEKVSLEVQRGIRILFKPSLDRISIADFTTRAAAAWKKILGISTDLRSSLRIVGGEFFQSPEERSMFFLSIGIAALKESAARLSSRLDWAIQSEFKDGAWRQHPYFIASRNPELPYARWSWIWQIQDGDYHNREVLMRMNHDIVPLLRSILAFKHLMSILSDAWRANHDGGPFYLSPGDFRFLMSDPDFRTPGLFRTLQVATDPRQPLQELLRNLGN